MSAGVPPGQIRIDREPDAGTGTPSAAGADLTEASWVPASGALTALGQHLRRQMGEAPADTDGSLAVGGQRSGASAPPRTEAAVGHQATGFPVGRADDPAEERADRLAAQALRRLPSDSSGTVPASAAGGVSVAESAGGIPAAGLVAGTPAVGLAAGIPAAGLADGRHYLRRSVGGSPGAGPASAGVIGAAGGLTDERTSAAIRRSRGSGCPLPPPVRGRMEAAFGQDLGRIRVHTDDTAAGLNTTLSARAFTTGSDIFFGAGEFSPGEPEGERVLAHEIAHAVTEPAGVNRYLRRRISKTDKDVMAVRSRFGAWRGEKKDDTLHKLAVVLKGYSTDRDPAHVQLAVAVIVKLCKEYLRQNTSRYDEDDAPGEENIGKTTRRGDAKGKGEKIELVEDILAEAEREQIQAAAQQQYLTDSKAQATVQKAKKAQVAADQAAKGQATKGPAPKGRAPKGRPAKGQAAKAAQGQAAKAQFTMPQVSPTAMMGQRSEDIGSDIHQPSEALAQGKTMNVAGARDEALALVKEYGLTEAEIVAIRTFTADDFKYINPATANDDAWMSGVIAGFDPGEFGEAKTLREEGGLHAGIALAGMLKLPEEKGDMYRGLRVTDTQYKDWFSGSTYVFTSLASTSVNYHTAQDYALGFGATKQKDKDKDKNKLIGVVLMLDVKFGRKIQPLSKFGEEGEVAILPGARFKITKKEEPTGKGVKGLRKIYMTQIS